MLTKQEKIDLLKKADDLDINIEFCKQTIVTSDFETEQSEYPNFVDDIENQYYYTTYPDNYEDFDDYELDTDDNYEDFDDYELDTNDNDDNSSHYWVFDIPAHIDTPFKAESKDEFWKKLQEAIDYTIDYRTKRGLSLYD